MGRHVLWESLFIGAVAASAQCSYPVPMNGVECWGLSQANNVTSPEACAAACCSAGPSCQTWQWCPLGGSCPTPGTCWIGPRGTDCKDVPDWLGGGVAVSNAINLTGIFPMPSPVPLPGWGNNTTPGGDVITVDSTSYRLNGLPWLQVMGEFQYSRTPLNEWKDVLARMRASGVTVVGSYIFWLHHEEQQGVWDWSMQRNLTAFVRAAAAEGLSVFLRVGPWAHGESRNGGFPDWLVNYPGIKLRRSVHGFQPYSLIATRLSAPAPTQHRPCLPWLCGRTLCTD